jgi:hypothetical protein
MPNYLKFIALAIPVLGVGVFMSIRDHDEAEAQAFSGQVSFIEWKSSNHGMPLIEISRSNGTKTKFHHYRIILDSSQLKVGDSIAKISGSKVCEINQISVPCIK